MFPLVKTLSVFFLTSHSALAFNFPYESIQLNDADVANNSDVAFGKLPFSGPTAECKAFPGDASWPAAERWSAFNSSLGGALIKGVPPAIACYPGPDFNEARCLEVQLGAYSTLFTKEDPTIPNGQWQLDNPCPIPQPSFPGFPVQNFTCNVTSYPAYVVNASTAKHVQLAVNFARNNNIRLTIKNTGHDFLGRNTGGGALQVWVHHLKAFEFLPSIEVGQYHGKAARVGVALEQYELMTYMEKHKITVLAPGSTTVGAYGGFMQGGGFSILTSKFGLMADQVLSLEVMTADGRFIHADPDENEDIFYAIRGGGPGNYGIVTSAVVKAYDPISISTSSFTFQTGPTIINTTISVSDETFWKGISTYFSHLIRITDAKGIGWNFISTQAPISLPGFNISRTFTFIGQVTLNGFSAADTKAFVAPLIQDLNVIGINLSNPEPTFFETYPEQIFRPFGPGEGVSNSRLGSRLFPRKNFVDTESSEFLATMAAIRSFVQDGGYGFHSVDYTPTYETAGYPGRLNAANPHLRNAIMHATGFDTGSYGPDTTPAQKIASHARLNSFLQKWRDASPGAGAYMNEADTEEPDFQQSFYGGNYERLGRVKEKVDPWGVFYAVTAVGSEGWRVEGTRGLPTQQGRLCRV